MVINLVEGGSRYGFRKKLFKVNLIVFVSCSKLETAVGKHEIAALAPENLGSYICTATNEHGSAKKTFTLQEKGKRLYMV